MDPICGIIQVVEKPEDVSRVPAKLEFLQVKQWHSGVGLASFAIRE